MPLAGRCHGGSTAASVAATGKVTDACYDRHGKAEFLDFLKKIARAYPRRELHVVVDNYHTHKHADVQAWLANIARVGPPASVGTARSARGRATRTTSAGWLSEQPPKQPKSPNRRDWMQSSLKRMPNPGDEQAWMTALASPPALLRRSRRHAARLDLVVGLAWTILAIILIATSSILSPNR